MKRSYTADLGLGLKERQTVHIHPTKHLGGQRQDSQVPDTPVGPRNNQ